MLTAHKRLGVIFFPAFDWAISSTHPEREERLLYTQDQFREEGLFDICGIDEYRPLVATEEDILRAHWCFPEVSAVCSPSHMISAGSALRAAQLFRDGGCERAFVVARPPGHHAMRSVHGGRGFCAVNNEAVMVEWLRDHSQAKRIAIIDTDCHHGDGTQDMYWHDPDVLFISLHQDGRTLYPGTGFPAECGGPRARGRTINIPLPPETSDAGYLLAIERIVLPILHDFKPDLIINSAGQDNHFSDPITSMNFTAQGYARLTELLQPDIAVLEGGYAIHGALPYVNLGIALALAGMDFSAVQEPERQKQSLREKASTLEYIQALAEYLPELYFHPQGGEYLREKGFFLRQRSIYYDTDNFTERQTERLKDCSHCPGYVLLESSSPHVRQSAGIHIPPQACPHCVQEAWEQFAMIKKTGVLVQICDRVQKKHGYMG